MTLSVTRNQQWNIGAICSRQQCEDGRADKVALRWISPALEQTQFTFQDLEHVSNQFANCLRNLGFQAGDCIFIFLPKLPEVFFTFLGILKLTAVAGMLFANFGEEALRDRLEDAQAQGIITKKSLLKKLIPLLPHLPGLKSIIVIDADEDLAANILSYKALMHAASTAFEVPPTAPDTPSVLHYTSGSTGKPKGVLHVHQSILTQRQTMREILHVRDDDMYWCTADQGWVTGTSYGIIGPWSLGVTQVHFGGAYDAEQWFTIIERERVTVWYTAPTALRMLMREDPALFQKFDLSPLCSISSVGEPLNPEVILWARRTFGKEIYDTWFQTETGSIMIANCPGLPVKPGSMGKPITGLDAAIMGETGTEQPENIPGHLCLKAGWPSMFRTYMNKDAAYRAKFKNGWYYSGDLAYKDKDGYFWFVGRSDDVINTAGHLLSPFEVESALLEIEEIAESGVVGVPDDLLYEKVVAFVNLKPKYQWTEDLELKIRLYISNRVSSIATPQDIRVVASIPKTKSGKIMRRVLKAQYLGHDVGDISTLEV